MKGISNPHIGLRYKAQHIQKNTPREDSGYEFTYIGDKWPMLYKYVEHDHWQAYLPDVKLTIHEPSFTMLKTTAHRLIEKHKRQHT